MDEKRNGKECLGTMRVTQVGIVVKDIEKTAASWADFLGEEIPEIVMTDPVEIANTELRGKATPARARLAFFEMENITIELIEPVGGPSTWKEFLDTHGEGVHHIAFNIRGMEEKVVLLEQKDMLLLQKGDYTGGRYGYIDSQPQLGVILELLENF
ncbi:MAG TPA: VOC family protein [bacterium]|nr:VOC family protein [bacterium]HPN45915.1 VOC family protein [bacterium]